MNRPKRAIRSTTRSASSIDIPCPLDRFDPELNHQKEVDLRQPQAGYRVCSTVASSHEIEESLNLAAMTLLDIIRHNVHALS